MNKHASNNLADNSTPDNSVDNSAPIEFTKMNGLGNDFVIIDNRTRALTFTPENIQKIANRQTGIGCDQFITLEPAKDADLFMRIINADGSEVDACGNVTRCVAWLIKEETGKANPVIETNAGLLGTLVKDRDNVTVDMGKPKFDWDAIPLSEKFHNTRGIELQVGPIDDPVLHTPSVVNVGNPHCIFWVDDLDAHDLGAIGPILENHPLFPERANISLALVNSPEQITIRVWERGAGLTRACGTAACATAVAAARKRLTGREVKIILPGGPLLIHWDQDDHILMTGPTELEYTGMIDPQTWTKISA